MRNFIPTMGRLGLAPLALVLSSLAACAESSNVRKADVVLVQADNGAHGYIAPKSVGSYPSSKQRIQRWIDAGNLDSIRAHGWDMWASITATAADSNPTWQTWYSGHEIFESIATPTSAARPRNVRLPLERPRQIGHRFRVVGVGPSGRRRIPIDTAERVFAFNRFTSPTAQYIWNKHLNNGNMLADTNAAFIKTNAPLAMRQVLASADSVDVGSFVIKCVFQFISGSGPTAIPYWAGDGSAFSTDSLHPPPRMWKQAVAVDPTGKLQPGDSVLLAFNKQPPSWLKVVPMSAFYYVRVTVADSANLTNFGAENGDDLGFNSDTSEAAVRAAARPGNYGLLMAMHVTGKEIANWTWQSFWWAGNPQDPQFGADRPASIPAPWNHYNMTVAYSMLTRAGQPNIAFNPYLETSLAGKVPVEGGAPGDSLAWTGITTNCMSCHRRAGIGYAPPNVIVGPQYGPAAYVDPGDSIIFTVPVSGIAGRVPTMKTDFLWSVAIRASAPTSIPGRTVAKLPATRK